MTVLDEWNLYVKMVYGDASTLNKQQLKETRRAFYAGNYTMLSLVKRASESDEDTAIATLDKIHAELVAFLAEIQAGTK